MKLRSAIQLAAVFALFSAPMYVSARPPGPPPGPPPGDGPWVEPGPREGPRGKPDDRPPGPPPWGRGGGPMGPEEWSGWVGIERLAGRVFLPVPEDRGPLRPGEAEELLEFARERAPRVYRAMAGLRERSPERFRARMEQAAPRLRHLKRVYELSPRLGELLESYSRGMFDLEHLRRELRDLHERDREAFEREVERLRPQLAELMTIELDALEALAGQLEEHFERHVVERLGGLLAEDARLDDKPPMIRELVEAIRDASGEEAAELTSRLRACIERHLRVEIEMLRRRSEDGRAHMGVAIEHRFERNRRWLERPPGPSPGGWRERGDGPDGGPPMRDPRWERPGQRERMRGR